MKVVAEKKDGQDGLMMGRIHRHRDVILSINSEKKRGKKESRLPDPVDQ